MRRTIDGVTSTLTNSILDAIDWLEELPSRICVDRDRLWDWATEESRFVHDTVTDADILWWAGLMVVGGVAVVGTVGLLAR